MDFGDFNPGAWFGAIAAPIQQVASDVGSSASNLYKDVATAQNLALVNPGAALVSDAGRQAVLNTYGKYVGPLANMIPGGSVATGLAGNVLSQLPVDGAGSFLANLLGGGSKTAAGSSGGSVGASPMYVQPQNAGLPAWVLPAAIAGAAVVLALALRK